MRYLRSMLLVATLAVAASSWEGKDPDVRASAVISATPEQVFTVLTDLSLLEAATPDTCIGSWERGTKVRGTGATATVRYDVAAMHRKLVMTLINAEPMWKVEYEHAGPTGFLTQWTLTVEGAGTKVSVNTLITPPPWPFTAYYYETVKPDWEWCQAQMIQGIAMIAETVPVTLAPVEAAMPEPAPVEAPAPTVTPTSAPTPAPAPTEPGAPERITPNRP